MEGSKKKSPLWSLKIHILFIFPFLEDVNPPVLLEFTRPFAAEISWFQATEKRRALEGEKSPKMTELLARNSWKIGEKDQNFAVSISVFVAYSALMIWSGGKLGIVKLSVGFQAWPGNNRWDRGRNFNLW